MTRNEFLSWVAFWEQNPFDDDALFLRPAALLAAVQTRGDAQDFMPWLRRETVAKGFSDADLNTFKALGLKPPGVK